MSTWEDDTSGVLRTVVARFFRDGELYGFVQSYEQEGEPIWVAHLYDPAPDNFPSDGIEVSTREAAMALVELYA